MNNIRLFYTQLKTHWGYIVRYPGSSASQPSFIVPPPPTIVGSLAYAIARYFRIKSRKVLEKRKPIGFGGGVVITPLMKDVLESTITASMGIELRGGGKIYGVTHSMEPSRLVSIMYKGGKERSRATKEIPSMDSIKFYSEAVPRIITTLGAGYTIAPGIVFNLIWVFKIDLLADKLGIDEEVLDNELSKALNGIIRIGAKESLVSINPSKNIYVKNPKITGGGAEFKSIFYQSTRCVDLIKGSSHMVKLYGLDYRPMDYYLPAYMGSNNFIIPLIDEFLIPRFRLKNNCLAFSPGDEYKYLVVSGYVE